MNNNNTSTTNTQTNTSTTNTQTNTNTNTKTPTNPNHNLRTAITLLMAFFLSVSIAFLATALTTRLTILRGNHLQDTLGKSQYYTLAAKDITTNLQYRGTPFGIPEATLQGLITTQQVQEDTNHFLHQTLEGEPTTTNTTFLEAELQQRLQALLKEQGIPLGQAQQEAISEYTLLAKEEYQKGTQIPFLTVYKEIRDVANRIIPIALLGLLAASAFFTFFLMRLHPGRASLRYLSYSLQGAGLMTLALPAFLLIQGAYRRIQLAPERFYRLAMELTTNYLLTLTILGILLILTAISMTILPSWPDRRRAADNQDQPQAKQPQPQPQTQTQTQNPTPSGPTPRRSRRHQP